MVAVPSTTSATSSSATANSHALSGDKAHPPLRGPKNLNRSPERQHPLRSWCPAYPLCPGVPMLLSLVYFALRRLLRLLTAGGDADDVARDVELLVLPHQLHVLSRGRRLPLGRRDRILLAAASRLLPRELWQCFSVSPQTVLRWHRELVGRRWTYRHKRRPGRPRIDRQTAMLVLRLAKENPRWGYRRIQGELKKLGVSVSATSICSLLRRHGFPPAPRREGPSWKEFLAQQAAGIVWPATSFVWKPCG